MDRNKRIVPSKWMLRDWISALLITEGPMTKEEIRDELNRLGIRHGRDLTILNNYPEFVNINKEDRVGLFDYHA